MLFLTSEARVRGEALAALLPEGALSPNNCWLPPGGNARPPTFPRLFPNALALGRALLRTGIPVKEAEAVVKDVPYAVETSCIVLHEPVFPFVIESVLQASLDFSPCI